MSSAIPFVDLRAQHAPLKREIEAAIGRVLDSAGFVLGPEVAAFEQEFAVYAGAQHAVALNSGTSALHLALIAAGVGPGDEVITVPMTFIATVAAIRYVGARPVFVDVDPQFYTMDPDVLDAAITPRTKAIVPVHLYGQMAPLRHVLAIAEQHRIPVIEDAAQAHGAALDGAKAGATGHIGCFSFYPGKNLGACGEGGLLLTNDGELADRARRLRDWGQARKYEHAELGYNYRMDAIQGAVLRIKLRHLDEWIDARRAHAARYDQLLAGLPLTTPAARPSSRHVYHVYGVLVDARDEVQRELAQRGVHTSIHYPIPVHLQPACADLGHRRGDFPVSESIGARELSLPMFAELTAEQIATVAGALREALAVTAVPK